MTTKTWLRTTYMAAILSTWTTLVQAQEVRILSAVVKDQTIENATVTLQRTGESSVRTQTDTQGKAQATGLSDDDKTTMLVEKAGYSTLVAKCPCDGFTYALSPEMVDLDGLRVVLTWGDSPADLDSHLVYPNNHIYFSNKEGNNAHLDVDDTDYYGPETITVEKKHKGERYVYLVRDFSNGTNASFDLSKSNARVDVYVGKTHIRTYNVRPNVEANNWVVFGIDENGAFHDINQYVTLRSERATEKHLDHILKSGEFESHSIISGAMKSEAKRLNIFGESEYAKKSYTSAMYAFQQAVNLNPNFSQAYSNLGITYPKLNRNAEALWANRKAIELASGSRAHTIKASSYYNIARIYEKSGEWRQALDNFEAALQHREHSAYRKGITRMQDRLRN